MSKHHRRYKTDDQRRVRQALNERAIEPGKGMGQNFMTDRNVAAWIVGQLDIQPSDTVIEIGPGMGALTEHLVLKGATLILLEKDDQLVEEVRKKYGAHPCVTVAHGDALTFDLRPYFKTQPLKVIGALPYSVGTEIVRRWLQNPSPVRCAVFTLQKEVCDRLGAAPGTSHYGQLSVRAQVRWRVEMLRKLPPDIFVPRPKVDSGVVRLTPRPRAELPVFDEMLFDRLLTAGFSQRRKMLKNLLPSRAKSWEELAAEAGISPMARGQELTLHQWVSLTNAYDGHALKDVAQSGDEVFDVVDDQNRVIRQALRREVHANDWLHRAVHVFVLNVKGEVFLQLRSHLKDKKPGKWDSSAAGHLDTGEDYLPCAVRELEEELGIVTTAESLTHSGSVAACPGTGWEFVEFYTVRHDGKLHWPASEIETGAWFPPAEIDAWAAVRPEDFADGFLECWRVWRGKTK
ncbi:MAG TPA: 16S rRNA (adenine(1518)-N(6)/adenine(1519)-N(6))-dimethyltransferase RsmA [Verrucomicrobiales bacterium]|nr:16S rRNA (adenine(1518)-N(6)/adenine(1519)-N(6))-dimethyltransferase RsmA [Verrucomicrobiales bacterium]